MGDYRFKHIPKNAIVIGIGSLFKREDQVNWGINLSLSESAERSSIRITGAPLIRRHKTLSANQGDTTKGKLLTFKIKDAQQWKRKRLNECPALGSMKIKERNQEQWCFEIELKDGTAVFLPQFELARVLFLHDNYMSRVCLEHGRLSSDFNIKERDGHWKIDATPASSYPLDAYNDEKCRRFLSWVLMDPEVRNSFDSIQKNMMEEHYFQGQYQKWDFSFIPPSLQGASLQVAGWSDWNTNSFFAWEVRRIDNLPSSIPEEIDFYHPKFERKINAQGGGTYKGRPERPEDHDLDDTEDANQNEKRVTLGTDDVQCSFATPFKTNKTTNKVKDTKSGKPDEDEPGEASSTLSPNDSDITGTIPGADYDILNDETDDADLYKNKFDCFFDVMDRLEKLDGLYMKRFPLAKLPKLPRCKKHMLADDANPRCIAIVEVAYQGSVSHIIEVDTSDAKDSLSTMVLQLSSQGSLKEKMRELATRIVKKSISWPTDYLEEICGVGNFKGVSHPSCKHKGLLDPADLEKWADRFMVRLVG